ncbi:glycosyltransferase [Humibacillus xanthopallidus]|uniref:glycosyltransferase n=1 Tax=Humibacillus xanthopallidus TaxID=412689 RepID=UPI00163A5BDF|nr:glycosyltransferase family 2 protein [Humibacillus xanthopallidus]
MVSGPEAQVKCVDVEVVIPVRWDGDDVEHLRRTSDMGAYLERLLSCAQAVTVVDGSPPRHARRHREAWPGDVRMLRPEVDACRSGAQITSTDDSSPAVNGKVVGAMTGIRRARCERVVLADDDVRLGPGELRSLVDRLEDSDLVKPVNVFESWPWHAWWDGGRTLLNAAAVHDWPGVFALRRSAVLAAGGWSPHVLFENLELWRTLQARGFRTTVAPDIVVVRVPPSSSDFWSQRVRQAYDDLAQPGRLAAELAILPMLLIAARRRRGVGGLLLAATVGVAEIGRRRIGAGLVPPLVSLAAPVWLLERGICVWLALGARARGGVRYRGSRLRTAAHSRRQLASGTASTSCPRRTA